jgi:hypothetical protein
MKRPRCDLFVIDVPIHGVLNSYEFLVVCLQTADIKGTTLS